MITIHFSRTDFEDDLESLVHTKYSDQNWILGYYHITSDLSFPS